MLWLCVHQAKLRSPACCKRDEVAGISRDETNDQRQTRARAGIQATVFDARKLKPRISILLMEKSHESLNLLHTQTTRHGRIIIKFKTLRNFQQNEQAVFSRFLRLSQNNKKSRQNTECFWRDKSGARNGRGFGRLRDTRLSSPNLGVSTPLRRSLITKYRASTHRWSYRHD